MKKYVLLFCAFFLMSGFLKAEEPLQVMTFNIRMDTPSDGANQWSNRKDLAANVIKFYQVDLLGAQEVLHHQLTDLLKRLPGYSYVGVGRTDGATQGEYSPILYKKERLSIVKSGNFWLSEDPTAVGKKGWDAACERIATWAIFKDKKTDKEFFFLNTHLDHIGKVARHEGALLILKRVNELAEGRSVIVTGDFNATPDDDPIQVLIQQNDPRHLMHTKLLTALTYGPDWTFQNFGRTPLEKRGFIDYIFVKGDFIVLRHGVLSETLDNLYPSDHCPVLTTLSF